MGLSLNRAEISIRKEYSLLVTAPCVNERYISGGDGGDGGGDDLVLEWQY